MISHNVSIKSERFQILTKTVDFKFLFRSVEVKEERADSFENTFLYLLIELFFAKVQAQS